MANMTQEDMVKELSGWSVMEVANLVKALEEEWGVSAAPAAVAVAGGPAAPAESAEEQTEFDVELTEAGGSKIKVIKAIREIMPELKLVEAKSLVEAAPKVIKETIGKAEAEEIKAKLEELGAKVTIK